MRTVKDYLSMDYIPVKEREILLDEMSMKVEKLETVAAKLKKQEEQHHNKPASKVKGRVRE